MPDLVSALGGFTVFAAGMRVLALSVACLWIGACGGTFETRSGGVDFSSDVAALQPFDVGLRCRPGVSTCTDQVSALLEPMLVMLGPAYDGPGVEDASGSPVGGSLLLVFHRDPAVPWRSSDATGGSTKRVAVDLGRFVLGTGAAYVVLESDDQALRFSLPDAMAEGLLSALYLRP